MKKVLIYQDYGCSDISRLHDELKKYYQPLGIQVGKTDAESILTQNSLSKSVVAFFMPGGASLPFYEKLGARGRSKIQQYVEQGGQYVGICAGAYFACEKIVFEKNIPELAIQTQKALRLINATAEGSLANSLHLNPYSDSADSAAIVQVAWAQDGEKHAVYYHGGPRFEPHEQVEVLAVYDQIKGAPPAIIRKTIGAGQVLISGVHFEVTARHLQKICFPFALDKSYLQQNANALSQGEVSRKLLFNKIMSRVRT